MTVYGPLSSQSQDNKGSRNIASSDNPAPLHPPRQGRATSDFRCPRELDVLLIYVGSRETPGRVHGPPSISSQADRAYLKALETWLDMCPEMRTTE